MGLSSVPIIMISTSKIPSPFSTLSSHFQTTLSFFGGASVRTPQLTININIALSSLSTQRHIQFIKFPEGAMKRFHIPFLEESSGDISKISTPCIFPSISNRSKPVDCSRSVGTVPGSAPGGSRSSNDLISISRSHPG